MQGSGLDDILARHMERLFWRTPTGLPRAPLPWDSLGDNDRARLPLLLRLKPRLGTPLFIAGALFFSYGFVTNHQGIFALGCGLLFVTVRAYLQAWRQLGHIEVTVNKSPLKVTVGESITLEFEIQNHGAHRLGRLNLYGICNAATESEAYVFETELAPNTRRRTHLSWLADVGMGRFTFAAPCLVVADDLGLFPLAVAIPLIEVPDVTVEPTPEALPNFAMRESGAATDAGSLEARDIGDAVIVRGLRPWRVGDGMRKIDWKRSQRTGSLLVKEFERVSSTNATLFFDLSSDNQTQFGSLSTFHALRSSALTLADWLLGQRVKSRLITANINMSLGVGRDDAILLRDLVRDMTPRSDTTLKEVIDAHLAVVEPDSLTVLFACAANLNLEDLWDAFIHLDERRVEIILILVDSGAYARAIGRKIKVEDEDRPFINALMAEVGEASTGALKSLAAKLLARTYILTPETSLAGLAGTTDNS